MSLTGLGRAAPGGSPERSRYHGAVATARLLRPVGIVVAAVSGIVLLVAAAVAVLLTPVWVFGEQDRTGVERLTGYTPQEVRQATGAILADLFTGGDFSVRVRGQPVLAAREVRHMEDVRDWFRRLFAGAAVALVALVILGRWGGGDLVWQGLAWSGGITAVVVLALAGASLVAFDQVFALFHALFFPPGTYTFDPARDRLVQLFPEAFWFDTALALGGLLLAGGLALRAVARRRLAAAREGDRKEVLR